MKGAFRIGLVGGFIAGVIVALTMDIVFKDALGGSWADAVSHDLSLLLEKPVSKSSFVVILGVVILIGFIGVIGAFMGAVVGVLLYKLFSLLRN